jgi:hypothetical protein
MNNKRKKEEENVQTYKLNEKKLNKYLHTPQLLYTMNIHKFPSVHLTNNLLFWEQFRVNFRHHYMCLKILPRQGLIRWRSEHSQTHLWFSRRPEGWNWHASIQMAEVPHAETKDGALCYWGLKVPASFTHSLKALLAASQGQKLAKPDACSEILSNNCRDRRGSAVTVQSRDAAELCAFTSSESAAGYWARAPLKETSCITCAPAKFWRAIWVNELRMPWMEGDLHVSEKGLAQVFSEATSSGRLWSYGHNTDVSRGKAQVRYGQTAFTHPAPH